MPGKCLFIIFSFVLFVLASACAKSNYQDLPDLSGDENQALQACQLSFLKFNLCVDLVWQEKPTDSQAHSFLLKYYAKENPHENIEPDASPAVILWMPDMGHGSSPVQIEKVSDGVYRVFKVHFIMPGLWEIRLQMKDGSNVIDQTVYQITI